jgi:alkanesulfonate monooxygenase SsuD/methylene tetrahydromethanopterin reductase-like flavin-dependent oxidoreductase (luciferase family)
VLVGTAEDIADDFQRWLEQGGADGPIMPAVMPEQLSLFVEMVIPELRRSACSARSMSSALRENLGLPAIGA